MKKFLGLLLTAIFMMTVLTACDTQTTSNTEEDTQQETQTTIDEQNTEDNQEETATATPAPTAEEENVDAAETEAPSVSDEAASDDQSSDVKGETANDPSIQRDIDDTRELIDAGYYDDAQSMLKNLRTRDLTAAQKVEVEKLQKILDEKNNA